MSYVRIWVHLVYSTKNRHPYLIKNIRYKPQNHIIENGKQKSIFIQAVNGYTDHLHCHISLGGEQNLAEIARLIEGESAFWINGNHLIDKTFRWQNEYYAVSVSESNVEIVKNYIKNQKKHHRRKSFAEEAKEFADKFKFDLEND